MADWPLASSQRFTDVGMISSGNSTPTSVTCGGSATTKGSWTVLSASTPHGATGILLQFGLASVTSIALLDISVGAAGSETVIVPNLMLAMGNAGPYSNGVYLPISIPTGSRLAARQQYVSTGNAAIGLILDGLS